MDSQLPGNSTCIKPEQPEVDIEYTDQDNKRSFNCSQNVPSLPKIEHSQMEKMMHGNMKFKFVKQELPDVLCEDKNQIMSKMGDETGLRNDRGMTGQNNIVSGVTEAGDLTLLEHKNWGQISGEKSSGSAISMELSLTNVSCLLKTSLEVKAMDKSNMSHVCDSAVMEDSSLNRHKRRYTENKAYKCDNCGLSFSRAANLKTHKRTHTGEKPYGCDDCGASFSQAAHLKRHRRTHTGEKPYKCDDCDASFSQADHLKSHKRTHTGEKPYKCDDCGASFSFAASFKSHKRTHTGEKPYKCDDCGASFSLATSLKLHKRTHTGEKPYKCDDCGASFSQAAHVKSHKRTHTGAGLS